jgi:putative ABC transport system permease protein
MRLYRALLHLYPASWRSEYGSELCALFEARWRPESNFFGLLWLWLEAVADTCANAAAVHLEYLRQDLRYAARTLFRAPGFTMAAVAIAAIGIGATTAAFTLVDHVLIRPLPFARQDRVVKLWEDHTVQTTRLWEASPANYRDWKRMSGSFAGMEAYRSLAVNLTRPGEPQPLNGASVTAGMFELLGVGPAMGRVFTAEDDRESSPGTVILSHGLWQERFGGDASILGRSIDLDGTAYTVIGVMPASFYFPSRAARLWTAMRWAANAFQERLDTYIYPIGRLKDGVSVEQAQVEMRTVAAQLAREFPKDLAHTSVRLIRLRDDVSPQSRLMLNVLLCASLCVLLIACTNLANLGLARAMTRRRELAVRAALGAGRERLLRQMLTESVVVAIAGGVLGVALAHAGLPLLVRLVPNSLPIPETPQIDGRVLLGALAITCLTAIGCGIVPALRAANQQIAGLREARGGAGGRREGLRSSLVIAEVAASVVLLVSFGLLARALWRIQAVDPGFRPEGVLTLRTSLPMPRYARLEAREPYYRRVLEEVRRLPGVSHAGFTSFLPMVMRGGLWNVTVPGVAEDPNQNMASLRFVTPDFLAAMGVPLLAGRDVETRDGPDSPFVAIVSNSFVRKYWPNESPLGRRIQIGNRDRVVIGVAADMRVRGLEGESEPQVYCSWRQPYGVSTWYAPKDLAIRTSGEPGALAGSARRIIHETDPEQPVAGVRTLNEIVYAETATRRVQLSVLGVFGGIAFLLAAVGIHGLLAFVVSTRRQEIGVRMALGAQRSDIARMMLSDGVRMTAIGLAMGGAAAYGAGRFLESLLAGVPATDVATYGGAAGLAAVMTCVGCWLPVFRALRVDPCESIRAE